MKMRSTNGRRTFLPVVLLAVFAIVIAEGRASSAPRATADVLLRNVDALASGGNPASMVVWGDAEPLLVAPDGTIFAAASTMGGGRIVAIGHGGFVQTEEADSEVFAANAVAWLARRRSDKDGSDERPIRIFGLTDPIARELDRLGADFERIDGSAEGVALDRTTDVVIASSEGFRKAGRFDDLRRWIMRGGGLLATETAWGILQLNPDLTLDTLAANRLLEPAGIRFTGDAHSGYGPDGTYPVDRARLGAARIDEALAVLSGEREGDAQFAARVAANVFANAPIDSLPIRRARRLADDRRDALVELYEGLGDERIDAAKRPLAFALFDLDARLAMELPARTVAAHPSSRSFPGPVGDGRIDSATLSIDPAVPGWRSTGLYVPPGETVDVFLPRAAGELGAVIQVGAWTDPHTHAHRVRMKHALRRFPAEGNRTTVASAIGGPLYIDLPAGFADQFSAEELTVEVRGAAPMPHYRLDETDLEEWRSTIRHHAAPWAELETDRIILTIPAEFVRDLDRPDLVMRHWDAVISAMDGLEPRSPNHWPDRPYRYVADASISWGYMYCPAHAPIAIPLRPAVEMVKLENFDADGPNKLWGHYHELGHAHQNQLWTDRATGEVTVNIFTVYALHVVNGYPLDSEAMRSDPAKAWSTFDAHRRSGKPYEEVGGPFPRLQLYALLWHEFGFEPFHRTFDAIRALPAGERPRNDLEERNTFLVRFSETVERNLAPYFEAWGVEVTDVSKARLAHLPEWTPTPPAAANAGLQE